MASAEGRPTRTQTRTMLLGCLQPSAGRAGCYDPGIDPRHLGGDSRTEDRQANDRDASDIAAYRSKFRLAISGASSESGAIIGGKSYGLYRECAGQVASEVADTV